MKEEIKTPEKVVLLDFCETVVKFQSADRYVFFVSDSKPVFSLKLKKLTYKIFVKFRLVRILTRLFPQASVNKKLILYRLKGYSYNELNKLACDYYNSEIKPQIIDSTIKLLREYQSLGYRIIIVSGGYDIYIKFFADDYDIKDVVSSRIGFSSGICTGKLLGKDCLWDNKVILLEQYLKDADIRIDKANSIAISDSLSDIPILNYVENQIIVHRVDKEKWFEKFNYTNVILWEK